MNKTLNPIVNPTNGFGDPHIDKHHVLYTNLELILETINSQNILLHSDFLLDQKILDILDLDHTLVLEIKSKLFKQRHPMTLKSLKYTCLTFPK